MKRKRIRTWLFIVSIALAMLGSFLIVAASPFALNSLSPHESNWLLLSNIGQTYGAISALLAAIGLSGVVATIALQIRESRRFRLDSIRSRHYELYKAAMDDPDLTETSYGNSQISSLKERKQTIFINLQLQFWLMLWEINNLPESILRSYMADILKTEAGGRYWRRFGSPPLNARTRKQRQFYQIVGEEYQRHAPFNQERRSETTTKTERYVRTPVMVGMLIGLATGTALGRLAKRPHAR